LIPVVSKVVTIFQSRWGHVPFFSYRLSHDVSQNVYRLELARVLPTSSRRLETAFIAGLLGGQIPLRDEFERIVQRRLLESLDVE